jgi:hypothetical protein
MQPQHEHIDKQGFRLRGIAPSRIDSFSDVVFGFALTLIVVSQAVPRTYDELHTVLLGFLPFATCFLLFVTIWLAHYRFFRRYGMHDSRTLWINLALLFTVLFYVYPLKFLFTFVTSDTKGVFTNPAQLRDLLVVYGAGLAAIYACFALLYGNAWLQRLHLRLNPLETTLTTVSFWNYVGTSSVGLVCCALALFLPPDRIGRAGYGYLLLIVWGRSHALVSNRFIRAARARTSPEDRHAPIHAS